MEPSRALASISTPSSSGRSSPAVQPPGRATHTDAGAARKDKAYRRHAAIVEKCLVPFVGSQHEWADYISFLSRLLKALQAHPPHLRVIPHAEVVALRLSQCMNPSLPSGVHQKALEVYDYVFVTIGQDGLVADLQIYLPGLVSTLTFASLSVRPLFLNLVERHIIPLNHSAIRPALRSLILGLLSGLDDDTSEDFDRVQRALDELRRALRDGEDILEGEDPRSKDCFFWHCFFLTVIANTSRRPGALAFLNQHFPPMNGTDEAELSPAAAAVIALEPGLLIRGLASGLTDRNVFVQRGFLDLVVARLPLNSVVLQNNTTTADLELLVTSAASVVLERDMSLNRRLWSWLLGPDGVATMSTNQLETPDSDGQSDYFQSYGRNALCSGLMKMVQSRSDVVAERARPFKIAISLMDRWEIASVLIPELFLPALKSVYSFQQRSGQKETDELIRSAGLFFDGIEGNLIWGSLFDLLAAALSPDVVPVEERTDKLGLFAFIVTRFNIQEESMLTRHVPVAVLALFIRLDIFLSSADVSDQNEQVAVLTFTVINTLVGMISQALSDDPAVKERVADGGVDVPPAVLLKKIGAVYKTKPAATDKEADGQGLEQSVVAALLLKHSINHVQSSMNHFSGTMIDLASHTLHVLLRNLPDRLVRREREGLLDFLLDTHARYSQQSPKDETQPGRRHQTGMSFSMVKSAIDIFSACFSFDVGEKEMVTERALKFMSAYTGTLWRFLDVTSPRNHVEACRCIWQLEKTAPGHRRVEAAIAHLATHSESGVRTGPSVDSVHRFSILWAHGLQKSGKKLKGFVTRKGDTPSDPSFPDGDVYSTFQAIVFRPLLLLLETLNQPDSEPAVAMVGWLRGLTTMSTLFSIILTPLWASAFDRRKKLSDCGCREVVYYLRHAANILAVASEYNWSLISRSWNLRAPGPVSAGTSASVGTGMVAETGETSMQNDIVAVCLELFRIDESETGFKLGASTKPDLIDLRQQCLIVLRHVYASKSAPASLRAEIDKSLVGILKSSLETMLPQVQAPLLQTVTAGLRLQAESRRAPGAGFLGPSSGSVAAQERRKVSKDTIRSFGFGSVPEPLTVDSVSDRDGNDMVDDLASCLSKGFTAPAAQPVLDQWLVLLVEVLPLFGSSITQRSVRLVETICLEIRAAFGRLQAEFGTGGEVVATADPEQTMSNLLNALETIVAASHTRLVADETLDAAAKTPEQAQGFFTNVVGVFGPESQTQTGVGNARLAVLLTLKDAVRVAYSIWSWAGNAADEGATALSFQHVSFRVRNRARRLLEHVFAMEPLECFEALAAIWTEETDGGKDGVDATAVLDLFGVLSPSRPRLTIPLIFRAIFSRTPGMSSTTAADLGRVSSQTSDLTDLSLTAFLVSYTPSIEDDAVHEIWTDCLGFLRDVLANPMAHRAILPGLMLFAAILAKKADKTAIGEHRRLRRELGDVFMRILTATFTTRSIGNLVENSDGSGGDGPGGPIARTTLMVDVLVVLGAVVPDLPVILHESDKINAAVAAISTAVIGPMVHSKNFPDNLTAGRADLMMRISGLGMAAKSWKRDISDGLSSNRILTVRPDVLKPFWLPTLSQFCMHDETAMADIVSRIPAPTTSGIVFGVGATSARLEADKKTQLNIRRIIMCLLSSPKDTFAADVAVISDKLTELVTATSSTAPSCSTRADVFMLLRALVIMLSPRYLAPIWPFANEELYQAIRSVSVTTGPDVYDHFAIVQACKLLDVLVLLAPDDFQPYEWIFVTDTIDAAYRPQSWVPAAIVDQVSPSKPGSDNSTVASLLCQPITMKTNDVRKRQPMLNVQTRLFSSDAHSDGKKDKTEKNLPDRPSTGTGLKPTTTLPLTGPMYWRRMDRVEMIESMVKPFLSSISRVSYDMTLEMVEPDVDACVDGLLDDVYFEPLAG